MSNIADNAVISVCRFVRPQAVFRQKVAASNLGGITLLFTMDYGRRTVDVHSSVCNDTENFDKDAGRTFALKGPKVTYNLDRFRELAQLHGGFTYAYFSVLNTKYLEGTLSARERTLFNKATQYTTEAM